MTKTKSIILTIIGTMLAGVGVGVFFTPNKIIKKSIFTVKKKGGV